VTLKLIRTGFAMLRNNAFRSAGIAPVLISGSMGSAPSVQNLAPGGAPKLIRVQWHSGDDMTLMLNLCSTLRL